MAMQKFLYQNQVVVVYKGIPYLDGGGALDGDGYVEIFSPVDGNTKMVKISELTPIPNVTVVMATKTEPKKTEKKTAKKAEKKETKKVKKESIENRLGAFLDEAKKKKTPNFLKGLKKGALHKELGVPEDKNIPQGKLEKASHSEDTLLKKRAIFAKNAKKWHHVGRHKVEEGLDEKALYSKSGRLLCPECGAEMFGKNANGKIVCPDCGYSVAPGFKSNIVKEADEQYGARYTANGVLTVCPKCGAEVAGKTADGKLVCPDCGFKLAPGYKSTQAHCKESLLDRMDSYLEEKKSICPECGKKLNKDGMCPDMASGKCNCKEGKI
jgi:DNA-directed RNA polymerase subunit RPC12/RpoP